MKVPVLEPALDGGVEEVRKAIIWALRDQYEVVRGHWIALEAGGGLGPATEVRILLTWAKLLDETSLKRAKVAAEVFETLRVAGAVLESAEGFSGPAAGILSVEEGRFLGEWSVPEALRRLIDREDHELAATAVQLAKELAMGRYHERGYRGREDLWAFDSVTLGILHGVVEAKYGRPTKLAAATGARRAGASEGTARMAGAIGEAVGMALGYSAVVTEDWDRLVEDKAAIRRQHIRSGRDAVRQIEAGMFVMRTQESHDLSPIEAWVEMLLDHFDALENHFEGGSMSDSKKPCDEAEVMPDGQGKPKWESPIIPPADGEEKPDVDPENDEASKWEAPIIPPIDS